ncbi:unnamed protein product, partial [Heterosigma akashiwo]
MRIVLPGGESNGRADGFSFQGLSDVEKYLRMNPESQIEILFIKRAVNKRDRWSGHVAFPGGKSDPGETKIGTAIRECQEEIGLDLSLGFECVAELEAR